jgi:hypothetical protein
MASFKEMLEQARQSAISNGEQTSQVTEVVQPPVQQAAQPSVQPSVQQAATDSSELDDLRKQVAEAREQAAQREVDWKTQRDTEIAELRQAARQELGVDALNTELETYRSAARNTELESEIDSMEGDENLDTEQVRAIARKILPLFKKVEQRVANSQDIGKINKLQQELETLRQSQANQTKMTVQDRVMGRAKEIGVKVDSLLNDAQYKQMLKERIAGSRQTHAEALYSMLQDGDVEDAAGKLLELQNKLKPDYAKVAATVKAGTQGDTQQVSNNPTDFNQIADNLAGRLQSGEITRTEHGKQVRDNFKKLFTVSGR